MNRDEHTAFGSRPPKNAIRRRSLIWLLVGLACMVPVTFVHGQAGSNVATNIPVLVVIEDEDPDSVRRSSNMFKRVVAELRVAMQFFGFQMLDEESISADLGLGRIPDRRGKQDLITEIKNINLSPEARHQVRAWVLFRVHAYMLPAGSTGRIHRVKTIVTGEIYDAKTNGFLDAYDEEVEFPVSKNCGKDTRCIEHFVGENAQDVAAELGRVLAIKLQRYSPNAGGGTPALGSAHGMPTRYTLKLERFERGEALTIAGVMADEFPGVIGIDRITTVPPVYEYQTTAKAAKLEEWLYILLRHMGFDADTEITMDFRDAYITLTKIIPTPNRPRSADETSRFS